jgi:non-ribosomal peptide synthase protein (TIGR01720 family)
VINFNKDIGKLYYNNKHRNMDFKINVFNINGLDLAEQDIMMKKLAEGIKSSMDIETDILFKACVFDLGERGKRLLLTAHHLITDMISWRFIIEDIEEGLKQDNIDNAICKRTPSYGEWALELWNYGRRDALNEISYWGEVLNTSQIFPVDFDLGEDCLCNCFTISRSLNKEETRSLLFKANEAYGTNTEELLLAALSLTIGRFTGYKEAMVNLERHGREEIFEDMDVSRTIGWFTSIFPVKILLHESELQSHIKAVKEQIRNIPNKGLGYGVLKYLTGSFAQNKEPDIIFNYLGDFDDIFKEDFFSLAAEDSGADISPDNHLTYLMDIQARVIDERMRFSITFSRNKFYQETVDSFADNLISDIKAIVLHCISRDVNEFTPSDFDSVDITQGDIDALFG